MSDPRSLFTKKSFRSMGGSIEFVAIIGLIAALTLASLDAEAQRRMGGGRSIGRQSQPVQRQSTPPAQQPPLQQATQPSQTQRTQPAPTPVQSRSRWLGPIAGLAAGLGIAAVLSHLGLGEGLAGALANAIVIALIAMVGIWLIRKFLARRRSQDMPARGAATQSSIRGGGFATGSAQDPHYPMSPSGPAPGSQGDASSTPEVRAVPSDFDSEAFLRAAKVCFVRLQAA